MTFGLPELSPSTFPPRIVVKKVRGKVKEEFYPIVDHFRILLVGHDNPYITRSDDMQFDLRQRWFRSVIINVKWEKGDHPHLPKWFRVLDLRFLGRVHYHEVSPVAFP